MFNLIINKKHCNIVVKHNHYFTLNSISISISFFSINVIGRIFRWIKFTNYMHFILPLVNKPYMFINGNFFVLSDKLIIPIFILKTHITNYQIIKILFKIRKPSIFNKRGFRILNKIFYKKKGKITTYVTNK